MTEAERRRAEDVAARTTIGRTRGTWRSGRRHRRARHRADQLIERFGGAPVLLLLVRRKFERDDRDRQVESLRETPRIVLDQLGRAGRADQHRLRLEPRVRIARGVLEEFGRVAAEVARLEGRVGHRRTPRQPLDHREQQVGVGVALRRVQHVVHVPHRGRDAHRADVRRSFVGPERELHDRFVSAVDAVGQATRRRSACAAVCGRAARRSRRSSGRVNSAARSPAWS